MVIVGIVGAMAVGMPGGIGVMGAMAVGIPEVNRSYGGDGGGNAGSDALLSFFLLFPLLSFSHSSHFSHVFL